MICSMPETSDVPNMRTSMPQTLKDKLKALTPERRASIKAEADLLHAEYRLQAQMTDAKR